MPETRVELLPAVQWICEECGRDNFARCRRIERESLEGTALLAEVAAEDEEIAGMIGDAFAVDGYFLAAPTRVACGHCGAEFATEVDGAEQ